MTTKRKLTPNRAAAETRHAIIREMNRLEKDFTVAETRWTKLREFIKGMAPRASKKKGGLGKR